MDSLVINFSVFLRGGIILNEEDIQSRMSHYEDIFDEFESCDGGLQIWEGANLTNQIEDELPALIKNLCFGVVLDLLNEKSSTYHFFSQEGQIYFSKEGINVNIWGTTVKNLSYPFIDFVKKLYETGCRFLMLLDKLQAKDDHRVENRENLIQLLSVEKSKVKVAIQPLYSK